MKVSNIMKVSNSKIHNNIVTSFKEEIIPEVRESIIAKEYLFTGVPIYCVCFLQNKYRYLVP